jgi:hypothetical protein
MRAPTEPGPLEATVFVEGLRANPAGFLVIALAAHTLLWTLVPLISEPTAAPRLAVGIALGREFRLGYVDTPPLAPWLIEIAYVLAGRFGALALGPLTVALAGWFLFGLARRILGERQGAMATLLMVGVHPVAFPIGAFDAHLLAMPLVAFAALAWWRAIREGGRHWIVLAAALALSAYAGLHGLFVLLALAGLTAAMADGRAAVVRDHGNVLAWIALGLFVLLLLPRLLWLYFHGFQGLAPGTGAGLDPESFLGPFDVISGVMLGHAGFIVLIVLTTPIATSIKEIAPDFTRAPLGEFAQGAVATVALAPALLAGLIAALLQWQMPITAAAALFLYSGLFVIAAANETIYLHRQRAVAVAACVLLILPPVLEAASNFLAPWIGESGRPSNFPAEATGRRMTEVFRARAGRPLEIIAGEAGLVSQIALASPDRPHVFPDAEKARAPWINDERLRQAGAVAVWRIEGAITAPPAALAARLPGLTPEAPLSLNWARAGRLDPVRLGWAIIPPARPAQ